jgi:glycine/D-amino acid oxidase-like deaminating enzyme
MDAEAIVIGAGIVGAACAYELCQRGLQVLVIDDGPGGATHAGMGHLVVMDDNPAELALSSASLAIWRDWLARMDSSCGYSHCGTLWIAADEEEMQAAAEKHKRLQAAGIGCTLIDADALAKLEPALRRGLAGALQVASDGVVYAPNAARWLLGQDGPQGPGSQSGYDANLVKSAGNIRVLHAQVSALEDGRVCLSDGSSRSAPHIVLAAGLRAAALCPELPLQAKKGHLAISARYPGMVRHQLVELGYVKSAHERSGTSVAFNVQPRPTGQLLIGSSRQFDTTDSAIEAPILARMLRRASHYLPGLDALQIIRSWTGFRAASPDGLPLIGPHPQRPSLWLALGHEGLGVTTATGTAHLIAAGICASASALDGSAYLPARCLQNV